MIQKNFKEFFMAQINHVCTHFYNISIKKTGQIYPTLGFVGQIKSFLGPHFSCRPCAVHACFKESLNQCQIAV
jgi:hypothetical protein